MTYIIGIEVEDEKEARALAVALLSNEGEVSYLNEGEDAHDGSHALDGTLVGVWRKPTQFCECQPRKGHSIRGAKYGWWICSTCGRPAGIYRQRTGMDLAMGTNLLPAEFVPGDYEYRLRGTHRSAAMWNWLYDKFQVRKKKRIQFPSGDPWTMYEHLSNVDDPTFKFAEPADGEKSA